MNGEVSGSIATGGGSDARRELRSNSGLAGVADGVNGNQFVLARGGLDANIADMHGRASTQADRLVEALAVVGAH